jgi:uncharacterized delta-60 repeat protein
VVVSVALMVVGHAAIVAAAPGDLDLKFGNSGVVDLPFDPSVASGGTDAAVAPDGRIYVLRQRQLTCAALGCESRATIEGLLPDGSASRSFGDGGTVDIGEETGTSLAVDSDGKVLVTTIDRLGRQMQFNRIGTLTRLNPNGSVDESFGEKGRVHFGHNAGFTADTAAGIYGAHVAVREDGRIVVASDQGTSTGSTQLELLQYQPNGRLDPSFGHGAALTTDLERGQGLAFSGHGVMTVADAPCCARSTPVQVASLLADGTPNTAFGGGERTVDMGDGAYVVSVLSLPGNRIAVVAAHYGGEGNALALGFRPDGDLDPRFGRRGVLSLGRTFDSVGSAVADQKGRITIVGGARSKLPGYRPASLLTLRRFSSEGSVDRTFGGGSPVRLYRLRNLNAGTSVLQPDGRLLVLTSRGYCERSCSPFHLILVRYQAGTAKARCFDHPATIVGTRRRDVLVGTPHRDVIVGLAGNDSIRGRGGNDLICGGAGGDSIAGGHGRDRVRQ